MGSGRLVGGYRGWRGAVKPPGSVDAVQRGYRGAGGTAGWLQPVLFAGGGGGSCAAGQTIVDLTAAAELEVSSDSVVVPPFGVYEIPVGSFSNCPNFQLTIVADCKWLGTFSGNTGSGAVRAYLNDSGMDLATRAFATGDHTPDQLGNIPAVEADNAYRTYTFVVFPTTTPAYANFAGPLGPQSIYLWVPVFFPAFRSGSWNVKNVHIKVVTI